MVGIKNMVKKNKDVKRMCKIVFFDTKPFVKDFFTKLNKENGYNFDITFLNVRLNEETVDLASGFDVVSIFVNDKVNKQVIDKLANFNIKLIATRSAGYNQVDLDGIKEKGIKLVRVPEYSPYAVAEYAFSLMMSLNRKIHKAYNRTREYNFDINGFMGMDLYGKNIGIIGTGKIGICAIKIAKGFGMNVLAYDLYKNEQMEKELGFKYVTLENLYKDADVISLHCPLNTSTYHIINKHSLGLVKNDCILINTSRGGLVDTEELLNSLKNSRIGAVGLDVYEEEENYFFEDLSIKSYGIEDDILARLMTYNNVIVTSHQAFFTKEAVMNITQTTLKNIYDFKNGLELVNEVKI